MKRAHLVVVVRGPEGPAHAPGWAERVEKRLNARSGHESCGPHLGGILVLCTAADPKSTNGGRRIYSWHRCRCVCCGHRRSQCEKKVRSETTNADTAARRAGPREDARARSVPQKFINGPPSGYIQYDKLQLKAACRSKNNPDVPEQST